jgi:hypothetical protein
MDQYRDLGMREYLDGLAAEDDCGDAVAAMRGHYDEVQPFNTAVSMIARYGCSCSTRTVSHATPAACAVCASIEGKFHPFTGPIKDQSGKERVAGGKPIPDSELAGINWLVDGVQGTLPRT